MARNPRKVSPRDLRSSVLIRFGESEEGYLMRQKLDAYRRSKGWTWKHLLIVGVIEVIYEDNPLLSEELAELLFGDKHSG
jgi:hypothetical protein